ncbi:MAG: hypothetical protein IJK87_01390 [Prevotella sp.]|nr:hypothetical protein [Prevotella sp.]
MTRRERRLAMVTHSVVVRPSILDDVSKPFGRPVQAAWTADKPCLYG